MREGLIAGQTPGTVQDTRRAGRGVAVLAALAVVLAGCAGDRAPRTEPGVRPSGEAVSPGGDAGSSERVRSEAEETTHDPDPSVVDVPPVPQLHPFCDLAPTGVDTQDPEAARLALEAVLDQAPPPLRDDLEVVIQQLRHVEEAPAKVDSGAVEEALAEITAWEQDNCSVT